MTREAEEKLLASLTAETAELIPFLPYLLQDLWALGSSPNDMITLIKKHMPISESTKILDIACGKGAVSINIAKELGINMYGIDLLPDFINFAKQKAKEWNVESLCHFICADANEAVISAKDYDCVILGGAGNILGTWHETLVKMINCIKPNGYILMDESYFPDDSGNVPLKYECEQQTRTEWMRMFKENGLKLLDEIPGAEYDYDSETKDIAARAEELIEKHPEKRGIFEGYVQSQTNQSDDLQSSIVAVTWLLQKVNYLKGRRCKIPFTERNSR